MAIRERPTSPHLQVYRWQIQMVTSILNRATGIVLSFGALAIAAALLTLMLGPEHWDCLRQHAAAWYGQVFLFGWTWCFAFHLFGGACATSCRTSAKATPCARSSAWAGCRSC
ncbi:hypothetical protein Xcc1_20090 [Xanthomonas campestris pv. campestris]|nr:hypothetical protein Xcc1_20090 [Xanthomonas campestris pv. campestris]